MKTILRGLYGFFFTITIWLLGMKFWGNYLDAESRHYRLWGLLWVLGKAKREQKASQSQKSVICTHPDWVKGHDGNGGRFWKCIRCGGGVKHNPKKYPIAPSRVPESAIKQNDPEYNGDNERVSDK